MEDDWWQNGAAYSLNARPQDYVINFDVRQQHTCSVYLSALVSMCRYLPDEDLPRSKRC